MESGKAKNLTGVLLSLFIISFAGCSNDDLSPITLKGQDNTTLTIRLTDFTSENGYSFPLQGGDGSYSVKSSNDKIVTAEMISPVDLRLIPINIGETTVTITDNSRNILILNIQVDFATQDIVIRERTVTIFGEGLTENEKKAITEEQLAQIPVKVGGGYRFIFTDVVGKKGKAVIYTDTFGSDGIETTFEYKEFESIYAPDVVSHGYEVVINNEKRIFILGIYQGQSTSSYRVALMEDVTPKVQVEYPQAESVYTAQLISPRIID
ncbi:MAG: pilus assembly protein N-terminal domain-containing protein [Candidatus Azobacteroides sp.]|nr:pilus assembly protein N-terminal domain-containing protein [Candidatus Azobacteroides sp.]